MLFLMIIFITAAIRLKAAIVQSPYAEAYKN